MKRPAPLIFFACFIVVVSAQTPERVDRDSLIVKDFDRRIADYVKLHKVVQSEIHRLKPTNSSEAIEHHEHHFAHRLREARSSARQGNIFTPEIAAEFRRLVGIAMQGPGAVRIRESLQRAAPVHTHTISVNRAYPDGLPLESTPPSLLLNLPPLPPEVEYRVVAHDLILRDIDANLVVDVIPNAIP
jgi:hypothetical protein